MLQSMMGCHPIIYWEYTLIMIALYFKTLDKQEATP